METTAVRGGKMSGARLAGTVLATVVPIEAWRECLVRELGAGPTGGEAFAPALRVAVGLVVLAGSLAAEACSYGMLWSLRGVRLPIARTLLALLQVSMLEPLALELIARASGPPSALVTALVGTRAAGPVAWHGGFAAAFASTGLLALARIALSALAQARLAGRPWREALAIVSMAWLGSHVALAWALDLSWGRSGR